MKKSFLYSFAALLASLTFGACSNDDDENVIHVISQTPAPQWFVDWEYNTPQPDWQTPDASQYESWMVVMMQVEDEFRSSALPDDMMAIYVGDELRGVAKPAIPVQEDENSTNTTLYVMKLFGNEPDGTKLELKMMYYSVYLRQIFTCYTPIEYTSGAVYGVDEKLMPQFSLGSEKYALNRTLSLNVLPLASAGITPAEGDRVAAFVGDECRGTYILDDRLLDASPVMCVFLHDRSEPVDVKYYSTLTQNLYTFTNISFLEE